MLDLTWYPIQLMTVIDNLMWYPIQLLPVLDLINDYINFDEIGHLTTLTTFDPDEKKYTCTQAKCIVPVWIKKFYYVQLLK